MSHFLCRAATVFIAFYPQQASSPRVPLCLIAGLAKVLRVRAANGKHAKKSNAVEDFINHHAAISHEQTHAFPVDVTDEYRTMWHRKLNFNWPKFGGNNPRRRRTENDNALFHSLPSPHSPNSPHHLNLSVRCTA